MKTRVIILAFILAIGFLFVSHIQSFAISFEKNTIFINGTVLTVDKNMSQAEAVVVKNGKILAVGTTETPVSYFS